MPRNLVHPTRPARCGHGGIRCWWVCSIGSWAVQEEEPGVHRLEGLGFSAWIIETDRITGPEEPILTLVSRTLLRDPGRIMEQMGASGHGTILQYVLQQIRQFDQLDEAFAMRRKDIQDLEAFKAAVMEGIPAEDRLRGLPPEERLRGLSLEERLAGLSDEDRARLRELLEHEQDQAE